MLASNAAKLCEDRGFPWYLQLNPHTNTITFHVGTDAGWYSLPAGTAFDVQRGGGNVNGDALALILGSHAPAVDNRPPAKLATYRS